MEYTEEEILDCVNRWENTGLLYALPLYEKQELAPIYDNVARVNLSKFDRGEISKDVSDILDEVMFPICRRLYRRVGCDFDLEKMMSDLIKKVTDNIDTITKYNPDKKVNPIVDFCVEFADTYEDSVINKKQMNDKEYTERVDKILENLRSILLNKDMVSFIDRTSPDWKIILSEAKKSPKQTRIHNQRVAQEIFVSIIHDTNKGV